MSKCRIFHRWGRRLLVPGEELLIQGHPLSFVGGEFRARLRIEVVDLMP
jgi:hypothetical protein